MQNFKNIDDLANGYLNAQALVGKEKLPMPSKDAAIDGEEYALIFNRLGRPSNPDDYKLPDLDIPAGIQGPTDEVKKDFKEIAHKIGLLPQQLDALYKFDMERQVIIANQNQEVTTAELQTTETSLRKKYGKSYDAKIASVNGLILKFGGNEFSALVANSGLGRNELFLTTMANIASNFGEDGELLGEGVRTQILSPEEAQTKINQIKGDKEHAWHKRDHAEHDAAMIEMGHLFEMVHVEKK